MKKTIALSLAAAALLTGFAAVFSTQNVSGNRNIGYVASNDYSIPDDFWNIVIDPDPGRRPLLNPGLEQ
ncbi:MAG: hypothetical protein HUJ54_12310, partial [Erysipelotrichaceae bacterium]|nr:hypothetical protein [Erysipelotrichaceae bacterium]